MPEADNDDKERRRRDNLTEFVRAESAAKGFDLCRITRPDAIPEAKERLGQFIDAGRHGTMDWMAETRDRRGDPRTLWSEVRSVVVFGLNYAPDEDPAAFSTSRTRQRFRSMPATAIITTSSRAG